MEFRVLGPLEVTRAGKTVEIAAAKQRSLLSALLLQANHAVPIEHLIACIWGEAAPRGARATTQTYVRRLRGILGDEWIRTRPGGYQIDLSADQLDLIRFDRLLGQARQATEPDHELALLRGALAHWRGCALANVPSDVLHRTDVPAVTERWLRALERRTELDIEAGSHDDVIAELRSLIAQHPLRERLWANLITALASSSRVAEALLTYEEIRAHLADELGADPSPALQTLHRMILQGDAVPISATPQPTTERRVKVIPAQLPAAVSTFIGRARHLAQLDGLIPSPDDPAPELAIAALEGPEGVGKTALAIHWAHRARPSFPYGQLYSDLDGSASSGPRHPIDILTGFLHALSIPPEQVPADVDRAAALYRSLLADRRVLVVLDNAYNANQVRPLLPGSGQSMAVITSRAHLGDLVAREGAQLVPVGVLPQNEGQLLLTRLLGDSATNNSPAVAELADLCRHNPLALRLAAAHLAATRAHGLPAYIQQVRSGNRAKQLRRPDDESAAITFTPALSHNQLPAPR